MPKLENKDSIDLFSFFNSKE